jgi:hypothetical protein
VGKCGSPIDCPPELRVAPARKRPHGTFPCGNKTLPRNSANLDLLAPETWYAGFDMQSHELSSLLYPGSFRLGRNWFSAALALLHDRSKPTTIPFLPEMNPSDDCQTANEYVPMWAFVCSSFFQSST